MNNSWRAFSVDKVHDPKNSRASEQNVPQQVPITTHNSQDDAFFLPNYMPSAFLQRTLKPMVTEFTILFSFEFIIESTIQNTYKNVKCHKLSVKHNTIGNMFAYLA